jgi:hypothetical protein
MAWLGRVAAAALPIILEWVWGKTSRAIRGWLARREAEKKIREENASAREQTEKAQTKEERDRAAQNTIGKW